MKTMTARADLNAHSEAIRLAPSDLVYRLREILGAKLVAYLGSVKETRAVRQWAEGEREPSQAALARLRVAYRVSAMLREAEDAKVVQAWFMGMNPRLDDVAPARLLREGDEDATRRVIDAARAFASIG